jgi:GxxExxY protein
MKLDALTEIIIGLAIKIHRNLGPGLLESVYQAALAYELQKAGIPFEKEKELPVRYENILLDIGFRCDFLIDKRIIVECKATREITEIDQAQVLNYLKIADIRIGFLINFNEILLKDGLKRLANKYNDNE